MTPFVAHCVQRSVTCDAAGVKSIISKVDGGAGRALCGMSQLCCVSLQHVCLGKSLRGAEPRVIDASLDTKGMKQAGAEQGRPWSTEQGEDGGS